MEECGVFRILSLDPRFQLPVFLYTGDPGRFYVTCIRGVVQPCCVNKVSVNCDIVSYCHLRQRELCQWRHNNLYKPDDIYYIICVNAPHCSTIIKHFRVLFQLMLLEVWHSSQKIAS